MSELGQTLKNAREEKGLSLDDLQEETKIQKRYLRAIEDGDFKQLPGEFYTRAFIKSYAESVGLNFSDLSNEFANEMPKMHREHAEIHTLPPGGGEELPAAKAARRSQSKSRNWSSFLNAAITVVIILIVMVMIWIVAAHYMNRSSAPQGQQGSGTAVSYKGTGAPGNSGSSTVGSTSAKQSAPKGTASREPEKLKLEKTQGTVSTYTLSGAKRFVVDIAAKNGSQAWFSATDAKNGRQLQQGVASAAGKKSFHIDASTVASLQLKFGSVPNTDLKINGKDFKFPNQTTVQTVIIHFKK
ncbi:helix-turn-helix domain-containing protein [Sporolactobacillus sp. THM7-4]|nr:helix-turn-helix domain-containing protein [Sporolactobacillus sp. THM7-4]